MSLIFVSPEPDPTYPLFPVFSFIGVVLGLLPLPWHLQAWNAGTVIYMLWASLASLVEFVDSIVWYGSLADVAPVWCDICESTKFLNPWCRCWHPLASSLWHRKQRLYKITSVTTVSVTRKEVWPSPYDIFSRLTCPQKLRNVYIDVAIAIGVPVIVMALHYIVQGHRYNIIENIGCTPDMLELRSPALARSSSCGLFFLDASRSYTQVCQATHEHCVVADASPSAGLTLRTFYIHRLRFNQIVSANSSLTVSRYLRLIALCSVEMATVTPLTAFSIYINTAGLHIQPWVSWANTHYNFSFVELFPTFVWQAKLASHVAIEMGRWVYPCSSIMFFMLFGFADEARRFYSATFWRVAKIVGITPKQTGGKASQYVSSGYIFLNQCSLRARSGTREHSACLIARPATSFPHTAPVGMYPSARRSGPTPLSPRSTSTMLRRTPAHRQHLPSPLWTARPTAILVGAAPMLSSLPAPMIPYMTTTTPNRSRAYPYRTSILPVHLRRPTAFPVHCLLPQSLHTTDHSRHPSCGRDPLISRLHPGKALRARSRLWSTPKRKPSECTILFLYLNPSLCSHAFCSPYDSRLSTNINVLYCSTV
uniref:Pheromone receptor n=1 Tax=Lentinus squarrosulus TaxID=38802 RepID=D0EM79_9APHY|nr:pheromone receptor [Lentinus squarrosulus]